MTILIIVYHSLLFQVPNLMDSLSGLYQLLDSRVGTFSKLCRLQGKLDLMLAQQTVMVSDGTPRDLATAINTPLMTVTAGGKNMTIRGEYSHARKRGERSFVDCF